MNKLFAVLLAFLVSGCSGCASFPYSGGDGETRAVQQVMKQAVDVKIKLAIPEPDEKEKGKVKLGFRWSSGSGVVVRYDQKSGHSLVLTAGHVCEVPESLTIEVDEKTAAEVPVIWDNIFVDNHLGQRLNAVPLIVYDKADLCVLDVDGWAGELATIATSLPPIGGRLATSGAPRGLWGKWFSPYQEGVYIGLAAGVDDDHPGSVLMGSSIPGVGGMSGSGVYYRGRLVGVLTMVMGKYEHISYLVNLVDIHDLMVEADKKWHPSRKSTSPSPS